MVPVKEGGAAAKDLRLTLLGALLLVVFIALGESRWLQELPAVARLAVEWPRLFLGFVYVLFIPGYWLTAALFPTNDDLDGIERNGLSLGLSVAWVPVLALILDRLPWGLHLLPIVIGQLISILLFIVVAVWRRERLPAGEAFAPEMSWRPGPWWRDLPTLDRKVYLLCAGALLVAGFAAAWIFLVPSPDEFMTEFYILGAEGLAEDYPREAAVGETLTVTLGIVNRERVPASYRVEVWAVDPWTDRRELVNQTGAITLSPGDRDDQEISWQMPWAGQDLMTEFFLYSDGLGGEPPYRSLKLWLNALNNE